MQTFLPYASYKESAAVLDRQRLGKQRVEAKQLVTALREKTGWSNHPAAKMWRGHEVSLCMYGLAMCQEWVRRGYEDNLAPWFREQLAQLLLEHKHAGRPRWMGREDFHRSHQSNLLRKDPGFYGHKFKGVESNLPYVWPLDSEVTDGAGKKTKADHSEGEVAAPGDSARSHEEGV